jgi:hypothetical protein
LKRKPETESVALASEMGVNSERLMGFSAAATGSAARAMIANASREPVEKDFMIPSRRHSTSLQTRRAPRWRAGARR